MSAGLLFIFLFSSSLAQENRDDKVKVITKQEGNFVDIYVHNRNPYTITLTLDVSGENYRASGRLPATHVYKASSRSRAVRLFIKDEEKGVRISTNYSWFFGDIHAEHNDQYIYGLPFESGESFRLGQGPDGSFSHKGRAQYAIDFVMPIGTPVLAARSGVVVQTSSNFDEGGPDRSYLDKANFVVIEHTDGTLGEYAHLEKGGVVVEAGQKVRKGDLLGYSGNSGFSSGPHLHFMVSRVTREGKSQSIPVKLKTKEGIVSRPQEGKVYTSVNR